MEIEIRGKFVQLSVSGSDFPVTGKLGEIGHGTLILCEAKTKMKDASQRPQKEENLTLGTVIIPLTNIIGMIQVLRVQPRDEKKSE